MSTAALARSRDRILATAPSGEVVLAHATAIRGQLTEPASEGFLFHAGPSPGQP